MLHSFLIKYLESNNRILVPQLGVFLVKEPGGNIVFSDLMKRDDGVLRGLLCDEGRNEIEAAGMIDRFVFEVRHAVENGMDYRVPDFGTFKPGPNGGIRFVCQSDEQPVAVSSSESVSQPVPMPEQQPNATQTPTAELQKTESPRTQVPNDWNIYKEYIDTARMAEKMRTAFSENAENTAARRPRKVAVRRYADDEEEMSPRVRRPRRRGFDRFFLFVGILAVLIALAAIAFGFWREFRERQAEDAMEQIEQLFR